MQNNWSKVGTIYLQFVGVFHKIIKSLAPVGYETIRVASTIHKTSQDWLKKEQWNLALKH